LVPESRNQRSKKAGRGPVESEGILALDLAAVRLKDALHRISIPLANAARAFHEQRVWRSFCVRNANDYAVDRFDRTGRWVRDLARLGRGLEELPGLEAALTGDDGDRSIGRVAATSIAGVADEASVGAWIALARQVSARELKKQVALAKESGSTIPPDEDEDDSSAGDDGQDNGDDDEDRHLVRFLMPSAMQAAFDDTLLVYRAAAGVDASATSFVEALVAEAQASAAPPDTDCVSLRKGADPGTLEEQLERATGLWRRLGEPGCKAWIDELSEKHLKQLEACAKAAGKGGPLRLHRQIKTLIRLEGRIERRLGEVLARMVDRGACGRLMFRGLGHYAEQRLGLARSAAQSRARVVRQLRRFPDLRAAYNEGALPLCVVAALLRIFGREPVERDVEQAWVSHAQKISTKRLLDEEIAVKRQRRLDASMGCPLPLDDGAWHGSLDQRRGRGYTRVAEAGLRAAAGQGRPENRTRRSSEVFFRMRLPADLAAKFLSTIESRRASLTALVDSVPWDQPWSDPLAAPSIQAARLFSIRCRRTPAWVGLLALLEDFVATWDHPDGGPRRRSDAVYARDGWRCMAPGCTARRNLEDHHLKYRSRAGVNDLFNRLCLCAYHHRLGEHANQAFFEGSAPLDVTVQLGRRDFAARFRNERRLDQVRRSAA
jgi:hypothetical protein